jgi:hypothetical protein
MMGRNTMRAAMLVAALAMSACFGDLQLSASEPQIGPNPAVPGDVVVVSFFLQLAPMQRHTVRVMIDDAEHLSVTSSEQPAAPMLIPLGDAAELIAEYGVGAHSLHIVVHAEDADRRVRTQSVPFELRQAAP